MEEEVRSTPTGPKATKVKTEPKIDPQHETYKLQAKNIDVFYGDFQAIYDISLDILDHSITAFIGPSGCGKSTLIRSEERRVGKECRSRCAQYRDTMKSGVNDRQC